MFRFFNFFLKILKVTLQKRVPENFRSCRWGAEQRVLRVQTRERGPPSALAEIDIPVIDADWYLLMECLS